MPPVISDHVVIHCTDQTAAFLPSIRPEAPPALVTLPPSPTSFRRQARVGSRVLAVPLLPGLHVRGGSLRSGQPGLLHLHLHLPAGTAESSSRVPPPSAGASRGRSNESPQNGRLGINKHSLSSGDRVPNLYHLDFSPGPCALQRLRERLFLASSVSGGCWRSSACGCVTQTFSVSVPPSHRLPCVWA